MLGRSLRLRLLLFFNPTRKSNQAAIRPLFENSGLLAAVIYNNQIDEGHMVCLFYDNGKYGVIEGSGATNPYERFDTIYDIANCDEIMLAEEDRINKKGFRIDTTLSEDCYGAFTYKDFPLKLKPMSECKFNIALK